MENMNKCPGCSHHCDRNNLQCGKGEAIFNGENTPDLNPSHGHSERNRHCHHDRKRHGHDHRRHEFPEGSLADLMAQCGHRLFHGGGEAMFAALTAAEKNTLAELLSKLLSNQSKTEPTFDSCP